MDGESETISVDLRDHTDEDPQAGELSFQAILRSTADGILVINRDNKVLFANERFAQMWLIPPAVMASRDDALLLEHVLDQLIDPRGFLRKVRRLYKSDKTDFDNLYFKDGRVFDRQSSPLKQRGDIRGRVWTFRDITQNKRLEEALRLAEENFRRSLDECPLGVRIVTINGETLYANRAILDAYGYQTYDELRENPAIKRYTPESYAEFLIRRELRRRGEYTPTQYEVGIVRKDGAIRRLQVFRKETLWNGAWQFQAMYLDITDRRRMEAQLRQQRDHLDETNRRLTAEIEERKRSDAARQETEVLYRTIFDATGAAMIVLNKDLTIRHANEEFVKLSGLSPAGITGRSDWLRLIVREDRQMLREDHRRRLADPLLPLRRYLVRFVNDQGGRRDLLISLAMIPQTRISVASLLDITSLKQMEEALKKREEELAVESRELAEANTAMQVLLRRREEDVREMEQKIAANVRQLVLPYLEELRGLHLSPIQENYLGVAAANLNKITDPFLRNLAARFADFTPREIQIANLIKEGKSSKEIAAILGTSPRSVEFHRDNVRKKLGLAHKRSNLRSFLLTMSEG
ncbi:MAG: PAS domain S-box protein [Smithellaceae bacterium]|nr:PAS domain S-box protein [Smithellaceae bacterium]